MIDLKTATYEELCRESDRVARAVTIPGGYVDPQHIKALDRELIIRIANGEHVAEKRA